MSSARGQRIEAYCEIIWGQGDYDLELETDETDDYVTCMIVVRKDLGTEYGHR